MQSPLAHERFNGRPELLQQLYDLMAPSTREASQLAVRVLDCFAETAALENEASFRFCEAAGPWPGNC